MHAYFPFRSIEVLVLLSTTTTTKNYVTSECIFPSFSFRLLFYPLTCTKEKGEKNALTKEKAYENTVYLNIISVLRSMIF